MKKIIILAGLLLLALSQQGFAQLTKSQAQEKYETFNHQWEQKTISTDSFLKGIKILSAHMMGQQPVFSTDELSHLLDDFREAAWHSDEYHQYRIIYFTILLNNADMLGKGGEAIFYVDKLEQERRGGNYSSKLPTIYMKCAFYDQNGNYKEAIKTYKSVVPDIHKLIQTAPDSFQMEEYISAIQILNIVVHSYSELKDSAASTRVVQQAESLYSVFIKTQNKPYAPPITISRVLVNFIQIENALLCKHYTKARSYLEQCDTLASALKEIPLINEIKASTIALWLKYYLAIKDYAHAAHYLKLFNEGAHFYSDYDSYIFQTKAQLSVLKNDYKTAYDLMQKAMDSKNKNLVSVTNDMNNLLYAHAEAEFNKNQLSSAEKAKRKRVILFSGIGLALLAIILVLIILYRKAKTKADKRIANLNTETNFQIAKAREEATGEEQSKLAQDLHDNYSAALAGIMNKLDLMAKDAVSTENSLEIQSLSQYVGALYHSVRDKSHKLYDSSQNTQSVQLEKSLFQMMDIALPDRKFKKEIDIDARAVARLPLTCQIEILRIVQECITNIVKHAKGANEVYLFIFQESNQVVTQIGDNGPCRQDRNGGQKSLGEKSVAKRVQSMNGTRIIETSAGYTVTIFIPIPQSEDK